MRAAQRQALKKVGQAALEAVLARLRRGAGVSARRRDLERAAVAVVCADGAAAAGRGPAGDRRRRAGGGGGYEAAWKAIVAALAQARYPVERRTYFSTVGTGRMLSFWLAPSVAVMKAAPTLQQALTGVVGQEKADALLERWRESVQSAQTLDVEAKPEMSAY